MRRSSHPPAEQVVGQRQPTVGRGQKDAEDDDWVNATGDDDGGGAVGGGGGGGSKARRQHWLNTAASRRGDRRFSSFDSREKSDAGGRRPVPPPNHGSRASRSASRMDVLNSAARSGSGRNGSVGEARGGLVASGASAYPASSPPGGAAPRTSGDVGGVSAGDRESGSLRKVMDERDLGILSSDEESVDASVATDTGEAGSDLSIDLNVEHRLTGGYGPSLGASDDEGADGEEWEGARGDRDQQAVERRRTIMVSGRLGVVCRGKKGFPSIILRMGGCRCRSIPFVCCRGSMLLSSHLARVGVDVDGPFLFFMRVSRCLGCCRVLVQASAVFLPRALQRCLRFCGGGGAVGAPVSPLFVRR